MTKLPEHDVMVENLLGLWEQALDFEVEQGVEWYHDARKICTAYAKVCGMDVDLFAAIVAAVSPRTAWEKNISLAVDIVSAWLSGWTLEDALGNIGTLGMNVKRAWEILTNRNPDDALKGPKIRSFWRNIIRPDWDGVTVDTWAYRACLGDPFAAVSTFDIMAYLDMQAAYQSAAVVVGLKPHEFQAVVWVVIRRRARYADDFKPGQLAFFGGVA